ncbi:MAG TPA: sulfite exporter TauE/SafE family protein [Bryobacteraceae bacterium]|nr:sulfite exporter TauE/SafE family protein [Bryobacteraceae bacterium]
MEYGLGFGIAAIIALTGVGAGSLTTPLLILLLGLPAKECVGTALIFATAVKILSVPGYMARKQVSWRVFGYMTAAGAPGVVGGALLLNKAPTNMVTGFVGLTIMIMALVNLIRFNHAIRHDRAKWLTPIGALIGLEMGFSSAGAGAIGALAMMSLTKLSTAEIVGTGLGFGLALSGLGGLIHAGLGDVNTAVLWKLLAGGAAGALAGSALAGRVPARQLRFMLCLTLVYIGGQLSWKTFSAAGVLAVLGGGVVAAAVIYLRSSARSAAFSESLPRASSRAAGE